MDKGEQIAIVGNIYESLEDFKESFAYDFGYSKTDRSNYPSSKAKSHMIDPETISREELIKRSWHSGNYLKRCQNFYNEADHEVVEE